MQNHYAVKHTKSLKGSPSRDIVCLKKKGVFCFVFCLSMDFADPLKWLHGPPFENHLFKLTSYTSLHWLNMVPYLPKTIWFSNTGSGAVPSRLCFHSQTKVVWNYTSVPYYINQNTLGPSYSCSLQICSQIYDNWNTIKTVQYAQTLQAQHNCPISLQKHSEQNQLGWIEQWASSFLRSRMWLWGHRFWISTACTHKHTL